MQGALYTGFFVNPLDIASNFSGTILGITNAFGTIPGWLAPLIAGALTRESVSYVVCIYKNWLSHLADLSKKLLSLTYKLRSLK